VKSSRLTNDRNSSSLQRVPCPYLWIQITTPVVVSAPMKRNKNLRKEKLSSQPSRPEVVAAKNILSDRDHYKDA
jgi:hypothetical protein